MKTFVTLVVGIVIGAGGMWFMQKSSEKTLQVDEVLESYTAPMTGQGNQQPSGNTGNTGNQGQTNQAPMKTGSLEGQINLSDANGAMGTSNNDMKDMNNSMKNMNNDMNNMNNDMNNMNNDMNNM